MAEETGYGTVTEVHSNEQATISLDGYASISFNPSLMTKTLSGSKVKNDVAIQKSRGSVSFGSTNNGGFKIWTSASPYGVYLTPGALNSIFSYAKEVGYVSDNNDKGESGKADYLTVDPEKMAGEIVAGDRERGASIALAILRKLGYRVDMQKLLQCFERSGNSDELQSEVSVDPKPEQREEPDPWSRFG